MRSLVFVAITITSLVGGCASDPIADACKRADECNLLNGSVEECTDSYTSALDQYAQSVQDEFRHDVQACLDHPSCGAFVACFNALVK